MIPNRCTKIVSGHACGMPASTTDAMNFRCSDHGLDSMHRQHGAYFPITDRMMHAVGGFDAFTRRGWNVRRAAATATDEWVVMAARSLPGDGTEYVVARIMPGAHEWHTGTYTRSMVTADQTFTRRLSCLV